ncbi:MAG: NADH-quinone oxidoreductase subunit C [Candidatus Aenigmatarchaeota archaeon]
MHVEKYLKRLKAKRESNNFWLEINKDRLKPLLKHFKSLGVYRISSISGVDVGKNIEVIYHLIHKKNTINIRIKLNKNNPVLETITDIYPGANLFERELYEMLGVEIQNHPNLKKLFLDENSPKNPLRRN